MRSRILFYFILIFRPEEAKEKTDADAFIDKVQAPTVMVRIVFAIIMMYKSQLSKDSQ